MESDERTRSSAAASADVEHVMKRLRRIEGQVRGIQRMIERNRDCEAIITQLMAARAALDKAGLLIMSRQIERCLLEADVPTSRARLERLIGLFLRFANSAPEAEGMRTEGDT